MLEEYVALDEGDDYKTPDEVTETLPQPHKEPLGYKELVIKIFLEYNPEQIADPLKLQDAAGGDKVNKKFLDELRKYREPTFTSSGNYIN